jgi:hypothetical protein|tara:strand:+ start:690 stop:938 length:249 start_codon:yes stop_codon:yes gene_type:complete
MKEVELEKILSSIVKSIDNVVQTQQSTMEFMQGQLEANEFLGKRIQQLETKLLMVENEKNVLNAISGLIPTQEVFDVESKRD